MMFHASSMLSAFGEDNQFYAHPEHYQLYELGVYDDADGILHPHVAPDFVVDCQSLVRA